VQAIAKAEERALRQSAAAGAAPPNAADLEAAARRLVERTPRAHTGERHRGGVEGAAGAGEGEGESGSSGAAHEGG